jgi:hypothetical protein
MDPINPFAGAYILIVLGYVYSIPAFIVLTFFFLIALRKLQPKMKPAFAWLASPICSALTIALVAIVLQAGFGIVKDYP